MENKVVFSIFVEIPDDRLDNPGWFVDGVQVKTEKSKDTKIALLDSADKIAERQMKYAHDIGGDYQLFKYDNNYQEFFDYIKKHQWLGYVGLLTILIIAIQLIIGGFVNLDVLSINEKYKFLFSI